MNRRQFLKEFLGALGAKEVIFSQETEESVSGTAIYAPEDPDERQDFCWHITEGNLPNNEVLRLAELIRSEQLLDIDQIKISRNQLLLKYNEKFRIILKQAEFNVFLEDLVSVEVRMVDEGRETDSFYMHE